MLSQRISSFQVIKQEQWKDIKLFSRQIEIKQNTIQIIRKYIFRDIMDLLMFLSVYSLQQKESLSKSIHSTWNHNEYEPQHGINYGMTNIRATNKKSMGGSSDDVSEEPVTQEKQKKAWRMSCDVGEATEGLENKL